MSTYAATEISRASTLIGGHAELGGAAAHRPLVSKTLDEGVRIVSASTAGGYGNTGAWGLIRKISAEELQHTINELVPPGEPFWEYADMQGASPETAAAFILEDGKVPLWHIVIEDMLRPRKVITSYFVIQNVAELLKEQMQERIFDFLGAEADYCSASDLETELLNLEPLLLEFYRQQKDDSKWKGQMAYHQQPTLGRKTLLNSLVQGGRADLLPTLLKFTHEGEYGGAQPWLVLADLAFGSRVLSAESGAPHLDAALQADAYGNTAFHSCVYDGKRRTLDVLLLHVSALQDTNDRRFRVLLNVLANGVTAGSGPATVLQTAHSAKNWACYDAVRSILQRHGVEFLDPLVESPDTSYEQRAIDALEEGMGADLLQLGECHLVVGRDTFVVCGADGAVIEAGSSDFWAALETTMDHVDVSVSAAAKCTAELRVKGLAWREATSRIPGQLLNTFIRWCFKFRAVVFSMSELCVPAMEQLLVMVTRLLLHDGDALVCTRAGFGIRPAVAVEEVGGAPFETHLHVEVVEDLVAAVVQLLPRRHSLAINIHNHWGRKLSRPSSKYVLGLFGCITPILEHSSGASAKGKGKRGSAAQNPLAKNPFMPGLCRVKTVAFDGTWRTLCGAHELSDAISEETLPFLRALCKLWLLVEAARTPAQQSELWESLRQARSFVDMMEPLVGGERIRS